MLRTALLSLLCSALLVGGCSQKDLGRYCFVGVSGGNNTNANATVGDLQALNTEAPECGERLCLQQKGYKCSDGSTACDVDVRVKLQPMCTQECKKNSDCEKTNDNVNGCSKFVCQQQGEETGFGNHCICVCMDFIRDANGNPVTEADFKSNVDAYSPCQL